MQGKFLCERPEVNVCKTSAKGEMVALRIFFCVRKVRFLQLPALSGNKILVKAGFFCLQDKMFSDL